MKNIIFSSFRDRKKYLLYLLLITLCFVILMILFSVYKYYDYYINDIIGNKQSNKIIYIDKFNQSNEIVNKNLLEEIDNIQYIYKNFREIKALYENNSFTLQFDYYDKISIQFGQKPINNFEIIIPVYLAQKMNIEDENDFKSIDIQVNDKFYTFKIVGVYNNNYEIIYTNYDTLEGINKDIEIPFNNYLGLVHEYRYLDNTISDIENICNCGASIAEYSSEQEIESLTKIKNSIQMCLIIISIFIFIIFYSILRNIYVNEEKNIALLKALGYKNYLISLIILIRILIILVISIIISTIIFLTGLLIVGKSMSSLNIMLILNIFTLKTVYLIFGIIIIPITFILSILYNHKYKSINVLQILSSDYN